VTALTRGRLSVKMQSQHTTSGSRASCCASLCSPTPTPSAPLSTAAKALPGGVAARRATSN
jgi:hypothetical protein